MFLASLSSGVFPGIPVLVAALLWSWLWLLLSVISFCLSLIRTLRMAFRACLDDPAAILNLITSVKIPFSNQVKF